MKPQIINQITKAGYEFMGGYRAADGICYYIGSISITADYGDKSGYRLHAWKDDPGNTGLLNQFANLIFQVSGSALATSRIQQRIAANRDLVKQLALCQMKRLLDAGGGERKIELNSNSPDAEFEINDPSGDPLIAQQRLRDEILREIAIRHANGEQIIQYQTLRDQLCAPEDWVQRAFRLLATQKFVIGVGTDRLRLTDEGHLAAEHIVPVVDPNASGLAVTPISPDWVMDCFMSYAGEDRSVAKQIVAALTEQDIQVWWDQGQITLGDRLSQKIDEGLRNSRYGLVLISRAFVAKNWPEAELRALHARAMQSGQKVILPVLIGMTHAEFAAAYPLLADLVTAEFTGDISVLADEIARAIKKR